MDKNTWTGILLIVAIMMTFFMFNSQDEGAQQQQTAQSEKVAEKAVEVIKDTAIEAKIVETLTAENDSVWLAGLADSIKQNEALFQGFVAAENLRRKSDQNPELKRLGIFAVSKASGEQEYFNLENDKLLVKVSKKGGRVAEVRLKEYQTYDAFMANPNQIEPMMILEEKTSKQSLRLIHQDEVIETEELDFTVVKSDKTDSSELLRLRVKTTDANKYIDFVYELKKDHYHVNYNIEFNGMSQSDIRFGDVMLLWNQLGLSTEKLTSDERTVATTMFRYFGEGRDYLSERSSDELNLEAKTNWVAFKHKFFSSVIISEEGFEGKIKQTQRTDDDYTLNFVSSLELPANNAHKFKLFYGPNKMDVLSTYDNEMGDIINHGWGIFGWVNIYMIQPIFNVLNNKAMSMGLIILLVTLIVKLIITPLTYKNYKSSAKMKVLKPEIDKINEKFKDNADPMKKQQETMALYRSTGVNPMAGCLPMLIQMPILLAVFRFFPSSIDLRHVGFLWAEDLSSYDSYLNIGFDIPFYGSHVSLFALLMAASTLFYTIMNSSQMAPTQPGMPNMKVIMYIFPVMMLFFFNTMSSGLSYYYFCGNMMNMGIMWAIKTYVIDEKKLRATIEDNKKKPKKKSKFQQRLEELQKQQARR